MDMVVGTLPYEWLETTIRFNADGIDPAPFALNITTGGAHLHTYLTRDEILTLANGLIELAQLSEVTA